MDLLMAALHGGELWCSNWHCAGRDGEGGGVGDRGRHRTGAVAGGVFG